MTVGMPAATVFLFGAVVTTTAFFVCKPENGDLTC